MGAFVALEKTLQTVPSGTIEVPVAVLVVGIGAAIIVTAEARRMESVVNFIVKRMEEHCSTVASTRMSDD